MATLMRAAPSRPGQSRPRLTKTFRGEEVVAFDRAYLFDLSPLEFTSLDDLAVVLDGLARETSCAICHGEPVRPGPRQRRLLHAKENDAATILPPPSPVQWVMIDVDKLPAPDGLTSTRQRLDFITSRLPEPFRDSTYYYQWSSSAGRNGWSYLSAHLFFWLETPQSLDNLHLRASRDGDWYGTLDPAVFRPAQVLYTAAPIFEGGVVDPLGDDRSGIVRKEHATAPVTLYIPPYRPRPVMSARQKEARNPGAQLAVLLDEIGAPHFHEPIRAAIAHHVAVTPRLLWREDWLREEIRSRIAGSGREYMSDFPAYYKRLWEGAVARFWQS